jgi:hypothetical protein
LPITAMDVAPGKEVLVRALYYKEKIWKQLILLFKNITERF